MVYISVPSAADAVPQRNTCDAGQPAPGVTSMHPAGGAGGVLIAKAGVAVSPKKVAAATSKPENMDRFMFCPLVD